MATIFDISGKGLKFNTSEEIAEYMHDLNEMHDVEEINISGNSFGIQACQALAQALAGKSRLRKCNFSDIFTGRLITEIPQSITALTGALIDLNVQMLNLSDNAFGPNGALPLVNYLSKTTCLQELVLNNNGLGSHGGQVIAQALIDQPTSALRVFVAGRNRLENDSMDMLAKAFTKHCLITRIEIPQNGIRKEGVQVLMRGLAKCTDLQVLNLQDNTVTYSGALAICRSIRPECALVHLDLGDCLVGRRGGQALMRALMANDVKLTHLLLGYNELDESVVEQVCAYVQACGSKLVSLDLNGNRFAEQCDAIEKLKCAVSADVLQELDELDEPSSDEHDSEDDSDQDSTSGPTKEIQGSSDLTLQLENLHI